MILIFMQVTLHSHQLFQFSFNVACFICDSSVVIFLAQVVRLIDPSLSVSDPTFDGFINFSSRGKVRGVVKAEQCFVSQSERDSG